MRRFLGLCSVAVLSFVACFALLTYWQGQRAATTWHGSVLESPHNIGAIRLVDDEGNAVQLADYEGKVLLVFFGFTRCPDVCPVTMAQLAEHYRTLGEPEALQVLMITVDPMHDQPDMLQRYVEGFHPSFIGLTGSEKQIADAAKAFFVGYRPLADEGQFTHTESVALIDAHGAMRIVYTSGSGSLLKLDDDVKRVLQGALP